ARSRWPRSDLPAARPSPSTSWRARERNRVPPACSRGRRATRCRRGAKRYTNRISAPSVPAPAWDPCRSRYRTKPLPVRPPLAPRSRIDRTDRMGFDPPAESTRSPWHSRDHRTTPRHRSSPPTSNSPVRPSTSSSPRPDRPCSRWTPMCHPTIVRSSSSFRRRSSTYSTHRWSSSRRSSAPHPNPSRHPYPRCRPRSHGYTPPRSGVRRKKAEPRSVWTASQPQHPRGLVRFQHRDKRNLPACSDVPEEKRTTISWDASFQDRKSVSIMLESYPSTRIPRQVVYRFSVTPLSTYNERAVGHRIYGARLDGYFDASKSMSGVKPPQNIRLPSNGLSSGFIWGKRGSFMPSDHALSRVSLSGQIANAATTVSFSLAK